MLSGPIIVPRHSSCPIQNLSIGEFTSLENSCVAWSYVAWGPDAAVLQYEVYSPFRRNLRSSQLVPKLHLP